MLRQIFVIGLLSLTFMNSAHAVDPAKVGLYLSFEQRVALSYALLAQGEPEAKKEVILNRAKTYFSGVLTKKPETVVVKNFQEFLSSFKGEWPDTQSLALDMELLEKAGPRAIKLYTSPSERVQKDIAEYMIYQQTELIKMASSQPDAIGAMGKNFGATLQKMVESPLSMSKKVAETWLLNESEALLSDRMSELDRVGEKIAQVGFAQQQDPAARIYMQTLLSEYFARLSPVSKKLIISSFLGTNLHSNDIQKFGVMVQNSGPMLQKLLQIVARQANLPPEVEGIFRMLESSVRPVPWHLVEEMMKSEKGNYQFTYFEKKPLGVGTMAQVHRAKLNIKGERTDVVVRFIKPGMEERVKEDRRIMFEIAPILDNNPELVNMQIPKMAPMVEDLATTVVAEFDQEATKRRQKEGKVYEMVVPFHTAEYKTELEFHVPTIYEPKNNAKTQFMVQEMVLGSKLDKAADIYEEAVPGLKLKVIEAMTRRWVEVVLFGNGFYHSDLHPGNTMIEIKEPRFVLNILDFGMGGFIPAEMQRQVMVLGVGTDILDGDLIGRAFWGLSEKKKNQISETEFKKRVNAKAERIRLGKEPNITMELWMAWALNNGMGLPYEFVSLNRGMAFLNKLLEDAGSKLDITKITKGLARQNPMVVYNNLVVKEKVPMEDLVKLGWSEVKSVFQKETPKLSSFAQQQKAPVTVRCEQIFR